MIQLDADRVRQFADSAIRTQLARIRIFDEVDSTNSYLMQMPGPPPGHMNIAATSNQTSGRGRHGKAWQSPPGSGVCLSAAYTFSAQPENLSALTLALGLAAVHALEELGANGIELKWPNDLVALDGKLAGILTEVQPQSREIVTVVTGIGINVDLKSKLDFGLDTDWARHVVDLKSICDYTPSHNEVAGKVAGHLLQACIDYESAGFAPLVSSWAKYDWLLGRDITIDTVVEQISGVGAGVAEDGALLIETPDSGERRVSSGTVVIAGKRDLKRESDAG